VLARQDSTSSSEAVMGQRQRGRVSGRRGIGLWAFGLGGVFLLGLAGCNHGADGGAAVPKAKPVEVEVSPAVVRDVTDYEDFTGRVEAMASIEVRARVTGYLDKALFKEGFDVKEGETLFEIDPRWFKAELDRAEANVAQAEARVKRLTTEFTRSANLLARGAIPPEEYEKVAGDRAEAVAAVKVAEASRATAELNLGYTKVKAPISGLAGRRMIDPGNLVKADDTKLASIVSLDPIYATFDVDERTLLRIRRLIRDGKVKSAREAEVPVLLALADETGFPHAGTINFVDNQVDPATGTLRVRGIFPNPKRLLSPGLFVRVRLPIGAPHEAVVVPEKALGSDQGQKFVYVVDDKDEVAYRKIKVGPLNKGYRVVEDGVTAGERVIVSGLQRVRPKAKVEVTRVHDIPATAGGTPPPPTVREFTASRAPTK
jgi:RND family efflux transporter MFP subunit